MSTQVKARQAAQLLYDAHARKRVYDPLPEELSPQTIDEAYQLQDEFLGLLSGLYGQLAGYKLAYTTSAMQERAGIGRALRRRAAVVRHPSVPGAAGLQRLS